MPISLVARTDAQQPKRWPIPPEIDTLHLFNVDDPVRQIDQILCRSYFRRNDRIVDQANRPHYRVDRLIQDACHRRSRLDEATGRMAGGTIDAVYLTVHRQYLRRPQNILVLQARIQHFLRETAAVLLGAKGRSKGGLPVTVYVRAHDQRPDMVTVNVCNQTVGPVRPDETAGHFTLALVKADGRRLPIGPLACTVAQRTDANPSGYEFRSLMPGIRRGDRHLIVTANPVQGPVVAPDAFTNGEGFFGVDLWWRSAYADGTHILDMPTMEDLSPNTVEWRFPTARRSQVPGEEPDEIALTVTFAPETALAATGRDAILPWNGSVPAAASATPEPPYFDPAPTVMTLPVDEGGPAETIMFPLPVPAVAPPLPVPMLVIDAVLAPTLSQFRSALAQWTVRLDTRGDIVPEGGAATFGVNAGKTGLWLLRDSANRWLQVGVGDNVADPSDGDSRILAPVWPELTPHFLARLPVGGFPARPLPVSGTFDLGRFSTAPVRDGRPSILSFGLLEASKLTLPNEANANLEQLHSRRHARLQVIGRSLQVALAQGQSPVWRIRDDAVAGLLTPGAAEAPLLLEEGDRLVLGCYLLRFLFA